MPEFDTFLDENPVVAPGLSHEAGSALRGARIFGRWKSGTSFLSPCMSRRYSTTSIGAPLGTNLPPCSTASSSYVLQNSPLWKTTLHL